MNKIIIILTFTLLLIKFSSAQYLINSSGGTLIMSSGATLITSNNITNDGTMELNSASNVELTGGALRTISGSTEITFGNLKINNSGNVTIDKTINVATVLDFTLGIFNTSSTKLVTFNSGSSCANVKNTSHIKGPAKKIGSTDFDFPIGKSDVYRKAGIYNLSASETFTAEYFPTYFGGVADGVTIHHIGWVEYWAISREGTATATILLSWNANSHVQSGYETDIVVAKWNGSKWISNGGNSHTGDYTAGTVKSNAALNAFDYFTLGSTSIYNPLPVILTNFELNCNNNYAILSWETASEINNNFFTIEKSNDGVNFEFVKNVISNGNSNTVNQYSETIETDNLSKFYRLSQTDINGKISYLDTKSIDCFDDNSQVIISNKDNYINIEYNSNIEDHFILNIFDVKGSKLYTTKGNIKIGKNYIDIKKSDFKNGIYLIQLIYNNNINSQKLLINQ